MKKTQITLRGSTALSALALIGASAFFAAPAMAQDVPASDQTAQEAPEQGDIIVTGSRIRRPDLESTVPIASIKGDEIYNQANINVGEALNNLPQLRSTWAQQNPGSGIGIAGLNLLDLRGLGSQRTLVLVDGRRHVPTDLQNSAASVDINTIPTELIERVDIVTGGNSAVYGSDAIAGVVNFVMKKEFEGLQIRGGASLPEYGAGGSRYVSFIAGQNFGGGRGNIVVAGEYSKQDRLFGSDIPWLRQQDGFFANDNDGTLPNGSDGIPDTVFMRNVKSSTISRFGVIPIVQTSAATPGCGLGLPSGTGVRTAYNCNLIFDAAGNLSPQTGTRFGNGPTGSFIGGNGDNNREDQLLSIMPKNERFTANVLGHYKFSDAAEFFFEGKFARTRTQGSNSGPAFDQGAGLTFADERANFRLDNPFLTSAQRSTIANAILASGAQTGLTGGAPLVFNDPDLTDGDDSYDLRPSIADGSYRFTLARNLTDLGIRDEDAIRETYRFVAGMRGEISDHLSYEVSGNYGRTNEKIDIIGNVNVQRLLLAFDAGIDPNNPGAGIQCRAKFDPAARRVVDDVDFGDGLAQAALAADIAACVPYNPFGGKDNSAARNYIVTNSGDHGHLSQIDATAFISGDTGGFFNLPGGPIGFVVGGEWRREDAYFKADDIVNSGMTFMNSLQTFDPPALAVTEGFGELNIPLLKDKPFFDSLTFSGAARVSHYNKAYGSTGTVWAWNFGGEWAPIRDIRFRANYGKSVRAPNYTDTAAPLGQNFAPGFQDPCASNRLGAGTEFRQANCQTFLSTLSATQLSQFNDRTNGNYSLEILSGSNPNLKSETSNSLTVGAVIQPRFIPGFALTADFYNIKVNNVISSASAQTIVNLCYDLPDMDNQFCELIQRNGTGTGPAGEVPGQILQGTLIQSGLNFASLKRRGIDFQATYDHAIGSNGRLSTRLFYTHQFKNSNYSDPTRPWFENRILSELGDPKDEVVFNTDLTVDKFTIGYGAHYIGPMLTTTYENLYSLQGRAPQNQDAVDIWSYPSVLYHDIRFSYLIGGDGDSRKGFEWFGGIKNFTNVKPPLGSTATGAGSAIYDVFGRTFFTGFRAMF